MAEAKQLNNFALGHSRLCADYINEYWFARDGRFANARVQLFGQGEDDIRYFIVSDMKNGYPPNENRI